ncbi:dipeptide/oligopeptide/nickel ABC transporter permease/ATP-binding protein [Arthrobacter sp. MMS18-M83]|uniref:dipeptide/oligopeptide/nickel ABC transporter permease/ATP-binding protein n=1 Tax=Arthrobacter sp. MMS18-M83 TaxID=2996261 RepID=UPI00227C385E|nr:dipeptide/oligopeptide/nickel ABC transporter permease/ATP-binding protein [Arthrobacter sp. MMS18-M83]WAH97307.1 dipeptide/oligopeptide/nickel ABC transporter permease/ATP-binding protein [Arthrobacter sp. MMS18-M83]
MTIPPIDGTVAAAAASGETAKRRHIVVRLLQDPVAICCIVVLLLLTAASVLAPFLTVQDPIKSSLAETLAPMSQQHPLGADGVGRDVVARLLYGGQTSLAAACVAVLVAFAVGVPAGLFGGYYRGRADAILAWASNFIMAVPAIIILLVVMAAVSQSTYVAMAVLGLIVSPSVYRLVRASVVSVREELFVDAAKVSGLSDARIMRRHILPVVQAPSIIQAAQIFGVSIGIQAGIAFLGLGSPTEASWGAMLNDAFANIYSAPLLLLWPALIICMTTASLALLANSLRDNLSGSRRRPTRHSDRVRDGASSSEGSGSGNFAEVADDVLLAVDNLKVDYPVDGGRRTVVDGVSLTVCRGQVLGLVGESGSGKSQTAFSLLGLLPPEARVSAGRLLFDGMELKGLGRGAMNRLRGKRIAYVPQEPMSNLDPSFTIGSQLAEPVRQHMKVSDKEAKALLLGLLERVGINDPARVYSSYPHQISGGMAQRVLIAGAISCDPDLLIADEPTTALDVTVQAEILDLIRSLQAERNMGVILVTHDFGVVADICDRVAVMHTGKIVETASVQDLFSAPQDAYTRMLLSSTLEDAKPRSPLKSTPKLPKKAQTA